MFNVKGDMKEIKKHLRRSEKKMIPEASMKAINKTLFQIMDAEKAQIVKKLDRPTRFTVNSFKINMAKRHKLRGDIHIRPTQWKYLKYQIEGGTQQNVDVPTPKLKLNKFGNIAGKRTGYVKGKRFINTIGGVKGVWNRTGGKKNPKLNLLVVLDKTVTYRKRFPFKKIADGVARNRFKRNFIKVMQRMVDKG